MFYQTDICQCIKPCCKQNTGINKIIFNKDLSLNSIKAYTDEDGLKSSAIEQNATLEQNGFLYFGTGEGLVSYNAKEDVVSNEKPKVLITGAASGIGRATALRFAKEGL